MKNVVAELIPVSDRPIQCRIKTMPFVESWVIFKQLGEPFYRNHCRTHFTLCKRLPSTTVVQGQIKSVEYYLESISLLRTGHWHQKRAEQYLGCLSRNKERQV